MKTSCLRLAAFAAGLLVASAASVHATIVTTWDNWTPADQTDWSGSSVLYASDGLGAPDPAEGELYADGGGIYTSFYYSFFDDVNFELRPGAFETGLTSVTLEIKRTYNPGTNGPVNLVLHYKTGGSWTTATTPTPTIGGANSDDFTYAWDLTGLSATEFYVTWEYIPHSTFNEIVLTQD